MLQASKNCMHLLFGLNFRIPGHLFTFCIFSFRFQDIPCNKKEFKFSWNPCDSYTLSRCTDVAVSAVPPSLSQDKFTFISGMYKCNYILTV